MDQVEQAHWNVRTAIPGRKNEMRHTKLLLMLILPLLTACGSLGLGYHAPLPQELTQPLPLPTLEPWRSADDWHALLVRYEVFADRCNDRLATIRGLQ